MRRCIKEDEIYEILHACHDEPCGGHFIGKRTKTKVLTTGYYWPTLHKDEKIYTTNVKNAIGWADQPS